MALCYANEGVRINAILPGPIDTPLLRNTFLNAGEFDSYAELNPMKRIGTPEHVANAAVFLASPRNDYTTGATLEVDGGESISSLYTRT